MIETMKLAELNTKIANAYLNTQAFQMISQNTNVCVVIIIFKKV